LHEFIITIETQIDKIMRIHEGIQLWKHDWCVAGKLFLGMLCSKVMMLVVLMMTVLTNTFAYDQWHLSAADIETGKAYWISFVSADQKLIHVADGSGLSLYNYVTPDMELKLLRYAWKNAEIIEKFYPSLPIAGVDGTLKNRMKGTKAQGNVHAKTGTVTGVSALAGYCTASNGHHLCFSIINQGIPKAKIGRDFQDAVCTLLCR
jgi:hypothetical protein